MTHLLNGTTRWLSAAALTLGLLPAVGAQVPFQPTASMGPGASQTGARPSADPRFEIPNLKGLPDPTFEQDWDCYYYGTYIWNDTGTAVPGNVFWPSLCDGDPDPDAELPLPLVVLLIDDGQTHEDYQDLGRFLAFNGFIVAVVDTGFGNPNVIRSAHARTYINFLRDHWEFKAWVDTSRVAIGGVGRGGEAALTTARRFAPGGGFSQDACDIKSVFAIAATDVGGFEGHESLDGRHTPSFLAIAGSRDEMVHGYCTDGQIPGCNGVPGDVQRTVFATYDRTGYEQDVIGPFIVTDHTRKAMLFVERANHERWSDAAFCGFGGGVGILSCDQQHAVRNGYLNAWLRWNVRDQGKWKPYFTGEQTPGAVEDLGVVVRTQYSNGKNRRVIDDFHNGDTGLGKHSTVAMNGLTVDEGDVWDVPDHSSPHDTELLSATFDLPWWQVDAFIEWTIDDVSIPGGDNARDMSDLTHFSLRVGMMNGSPLNNGDDLRVSVRLVDATGHASPYVKSKDYATISMPEAGAINQAVTLLPGYTPKSAMQTVRFPLEKFTGVDLSQVEQVEVWFPNRDQGHVLLDSVEFTQ